MSKTIDIVDRGDKKEPEPKPKDNGSVSITVNRVSHSKKDEEKTRHRFKGTAALKKIKSPLKLKKSSKSAKTDKVKDTKPATKTDQTAKKSPSKVKAKIANADTKTLQKILNVLGVITVCLLVAIIAVLAIQKLQPEPLDEDYFVSDDTKSVIGMSASGATSDPTHVQTFVVYTYEGDKVTGLKTYFEYTDEAAAAAAIEARKSQPEFENAELNGKYIVVTAKPESYEGLTASDVKQQEEAIRKFQADNQKKSEEKDKKDDKKDK